MFIYGFIHLNMLSDIYSRLFITLTIFEYSFGWYLSGLFYSWCRIIYIMVLVYFSSVRFILDFFVYMFIVRVVQLWTTLPCFSYSHDRIRWPMVGVRCISCHGLLYVRLHLMYKLLGCYNELSWNSYIAS